MTYRISLDVLIAGQEKEIDFINSLKEYISALDGNRIVTTDGIGIIKILAIDIDRVIENASN